MVIFPFAVKYHAIESINHSHEVNGKVSFIQTLSILNPMNESNGTLYVLPFSHKLGDLYLGKFIDPDELNTYVEQLSIKTGQEFTPLICKPGDIIFMHPYLVHYSGANTSIKPQGVFIDGFSYPGTNTVTYPFASSSCRISLQ